MTTTPPEAAALPEQCKLEFIHGGVLLPQHEQDFFRRLFFGDDQDD